MFLLVGLLAGCSRQDTECLGNLGRRMLAKTDGLSAGIKASWKGHYPGPGLGSRVQHRLRWDKLLADTSIDVQSQGNEVELRGTVSNADQKRRAVELAETTAGVDKVNDGLQLVEGLP